jgi:hypothetical protein
MRTSIFLYHTVYVIISPAIVAKNIPVFCFSIGVIIMPKFCYMHMHTYRSTDEISLSAYQLVWLGKVCADFVAPEFIAALYFGFCRELCLDDSEILTCRISYYNMIYGLLRLLPNSHRLTATISLSCCSWGKTMRVRSETRKIGVPHFLFLK